MKLSHADFRPVKRTKYVAVGAGRKRPALRIAALAAFGILVYLKFDDFVKTPAVQSLRQPDRLWQSALGKLRPGSDVPSAATLAYAGPDSAALTLDCRSASTETCLSAWPAGEAAKGPVRALLRKAALAAGIEPRGFTLTLRRSAEAWDLVTLELRPALSTAGAAAGGERPFILEPAPGGPCFRGGPCPGSPRPRLPFPAFADAVPEAGGRFAAPAAESAAVTAMLPGRILEVTEGGPLAGIAIHHGLNLHARVGGIVPRPRMAAGAAVAAGDTLGLAAGPGAGPVTLRIEKDGKPVDALAFLGLAAVEP